METILVVDDNVELREIVVAYLGSSSVFQVTGEAQNGLEAVQMVDTICPQFVLMDVRMPVLDGISATRIIKERRPEVIVITYSGDHLSALAEEAKKAGASLHLTKPLDLEELVARMQGLLALTKRAQ